MASAGFLSFALDFANASDGPVDTVVRQTPRLRAARREDGGGQPAAWSVATLSGRRVDVIFS